MSDGKSFAERIMRAMEQMENPTKSATAKVPTKSGGSYSYRYETLDQVLAIVRPALLDNGLALTQQQVWSENTSSYVLRTIVFDAENERIMDERPLRDCPDAQAAGSWETYMRRYALRTAFGLCGEDDDGAATTKRPKVEMITGFQAVDIAKVAAKVAELRGETADRFIKAALSSGVAVNHGVQPGSELDSLTCEQANVVLDVLRSWWAKAADEMEANKDETSV